MPHNNTTADTADTDRPPIFAEGNRIFWDAARRFMIAILRQLDRWYGWTTIGKDK